MMTPLLTKNEAAAALRVSLRTVDRLRAAGRLAAVKVLGAVRFRADDVAALITHDPEPRSQS